MERYKNGIDMPEGNISAAVLDFLNTWEERPADFTLEAFGEGLPAIKLSRCPETELLRSYADGSYVAAWRFEITERVRVRGTSDAARAEEILDSLSRWLLGGELPKLSGGSRAIQLRQLSRPSLKRQNDNSTEEYGAAYRLDYFCEAKTEGGDDIA